MKCGDTIKRNALIAQRAEIEANMTAAHSALSTASDAYAKANREFTMLNWQLCDVLSKLHKHDKEVAV